jgi:pSer/pThr/pTyr-binding forkhead associated (FHA) protein
VSQSASRTNLGAERQSPTLILTYRGRELGRFPVDKRIITLGRHPDNDLVLDDDGVSRRHAQVITVQGDSIVEDLASRNGTFVNNAWVKVRQLRHDDEIVIAKFRLRFTTQERPADLDIPTLLKRWKRGPYFSRPEATAQGEVRPCPLCGSHAQRGPAPV